MYLSTMITGKKYLVDFRKIIRNALDEDIPSKDITTEILIDKTKKAAACIMVRQDGVLCGSGIVRECFHLVDKGLKVRELKKDGSFIRKNTVVMKIEGNVRSILTVERTALNFLQHLSGIATHTAEMVKIAGRYNVKILDTRKTLPGLRLLEKYAVRTGGGMNHRLNLSDEVLIKENHIAANRDIRKTIRKVKLRCRNKFEMEVENLKELAIALEEKVPVILLDDFTLPRIRRAVRMNRGRSRLEVSGGITIRNLEKVCRTGIDFISVGSITHSSPALDFTLLVR